MAARYDEIGDFCADWYGDEPDDLLNAIRHLLGLPPIETAEPLEAYL